MGHTLDHSIALLTRTPAELQLMATKVREILSARLGEKFKLDVVDSTSEIGSGALPTEELKSQAVRVTHPELSANAIAAMFRRARPPVIGRIKDGAFHLDMRTIEDPAALAVQFRSHIR